jgi:hypothetical protein
MRISLKLSFVVLASLFATFAFAAAPAMAEFGVEKFAVSARNENGTPDLQAGSHPYALNTTFVLKEPGAATGNVRDVKLGLPPGLVGNPEATERCAYSEFVRAAKVGTEGGTGHCPASTAVGLATFYDRKAAAGTGVEASSSAVFNLVPPAGVVAEFGFIGAELAPVLLQVSVRTGSDYGVTTTSSEISQELNVYATKVTIWGTPADPAHDRWRGDECLDTLAGGSQPVTSSGFGLNEGEDEIEGPLHTEATEPEGLPTSTGDCQTRGTPKPLLTMPTACGRPLTATLAVDSWQEPGDFTGAEGARTKPASLPPLVGCESLAFDPKVSVAPEKTAGSTPSGLGIGVTLPQEGIENPGLSAESDVKETTVVFPPGVQLNASAANGLTGCSISQIGYTGTTELDKATESGVQTPQFEERVVNPPTGKLEADLCPSASKLANVHIKTPLLAGEIVGAVYLAAPQNFMAGMQENPFSSLTAFYLVAEEPKTGFLVKLPGNLERNPVTGQLTGTVGNMPQAPFSEAKLEFFGGERASFGTPALCGEYEANTTVGAWSGAPAATPTSRLAVTSGPSGLACSSNPLPFAPSVTSQTTSVDAGAFGALSTVINRTDGQQAIHNVTLSYPPGVSAILTGVPECGEAQANAGTCGAESLIGEDTASVGLGQDPYTVTGGKVYLTGPYDGAPFGLSIVTPTTAGPFVLDEGAPVVTRAKIEINPTTAAVTVTTGEIPRILDGIQLQVKQIYVNIDRPNFTFNPTSCERMTVTGAIGGWEGASFPISDPFQVGSCASLKFEPKFAASTPGYTSKALGAGLHVKLSYPKTAQGTEANIAKVKVDLPIKLPSQLKTLQKACLAKTFEEGFEKCLKESPDAKIGEAIVHTQVLPVPLKGPAIFVSHGNEAFPSLTMVLQGDGVTIDLVGSTLIHAGITSTTFKTVPDVPFESFELALPQGKYAALTSNLPAKDNGNFCGQTLAMPTALVAQNGTEIHESTPISVSGCAKVKALTRSQKLQKALKACKKKAKGKRSSCEKVARKAYGPVKKAKAKK